MISHFSGSKFSTIFQLFSKFFSYFSKIKWNYCVLDEGHVIRNGKSKTSQSVKTLIANHRLILTGTPIQVFISYF